ncbi:MAG: hypothetical protein ABID83_01800 [Candidatus Omnitrophota bacterium]
MRHKIIIAVLFLCFVATSVFAVLPPKYYEQAAEESRIKATAVVESVKVMDHYNAVDYKRVTFKLIKSFGPEEAPEKFTARCESVNKRWFEKPPGVGGTIYYYPDRGERVYVTISSNDGGITSYTRLTPRLEKALNENFKSVKTKMGTAYVSE